MTVDRERLVWAARINEKAERYEDMAQPMKTIAENFKILTIEERNLLSVAFKNLVGSRRASWRTLSVAENRDGGEGSTMAKAVKILSQVVGSELTNCCEDVLDLLKRILIPNADSAESRVYYYKMEGDYQRYLAEYFTGEKRTEVTDKSLIAYKTALEEAEKHLSPADPIHLGLILNFSVFYYEILNNPTKACDIARAAQEAALKDLGGSVEGSKDAAIILQLLNDNLKLWSPEDDLSGSDPINADEQAA